ncbi:hypothetical protein CF327_g2015 [Tilletia walkeri]|nr:hypothetical protein CF327_g2015 [Tilletia walkeri]
MATPSFRIKLRLPPKDDGLDGGIVTPGSAGEDAMSDSSSLSGSEGGDELDELVDEVDEQDQASNMSGTPVKGKRPGSKKNAAKAEYSLDSPSPGGSPASGKKRTVVTREETNAMSLAELDDLPAAKRRRAHQARGASGPGRGWRKGLKIRGQKPVYQVHPEPDRSSTPKVTPSSSKGKGTAGTTAKTTPAVPPAPKGKPFKYPAITPFRSVPAIKPIARIPQVIPTITPLDRTAEAAQKTPRRWTQRKREILSIGGRPWSIPLWFGGADQGYPLAAERKEAAAAIADSKANLSLQLGATNGRSTPAGGGTPAPSTPSGLHGPKVFFGANNGTAAATVSATSADAPAPSASKKKDGPGVSKGSAAGGAVGRAKRPSGGATRSKSGGGGGGGPPGGVIAGGTGSISAQRSGSASAKSSPLTNTIPLPGTSGAQPVGDWRGSSPAFFAGARKAL